jgi:DNA polymerase-3 subunit epsilon
MKKIRDVKLGIFDVETTGLDVKTERVVEFGAAIRDSGSWARRSSKINPGIPIPKGASDVHGITDERVAGAETFAQVWPRILDLLSGCQLAGYNVLHYDLPLLAAETERHGVQALSPDGVLDVMVFVNWRLRGGGRKLVDVASRFEIYPVGGKAHSAAVDCQMTGDVLLAMVDAGMIPETVDEALAEQKRLAPIINAEYARWGAFLYRDRDNNRLRMGAGKHVGMLLAEVPKSYLQFCLQKFKDLAPDTAVAFKAAVDGRVGEEFQEQIPGVPAERPVVKEREDEEVRR